MLHIKGKGICMRERNARFGVSSSKTEERDGIAYGKTNLNRSCLNNVDQFELFKR